jgi:DNA-directed RNA polymerase specialized sigma24 family protein
MEGPKPLLLSEKDIARVHRWVRDFLPAEFDRESVAQNIILKAWMKEVPHVSKDYVRHKCIDAWRLLKRERRRNEEAARVGATRTGNMVTTPQPGGSSKSERALDAAGSGEDEMDRKLLVEEAVGQITHFERRLVWLKYWKGKTLEEIADETTLRREQVQQALRIALYKMRVHLT